MIKNPFAKRPSSEEAGANNRRSTRVDFSCPLVVTGRNSTGEAFREETKTLTVNLHGCKVTLTQQVLVGMVVTLESRHASSPAKAICVHVWDPPRGEIRHEVAVQLLKPQNIWGLEDPPGDWQTVAEALVHGRSAGPRGNDTVPNLSPAVAAATAKLPPAPASAASKAAAPAVAEPAAPPAATPPKILPAPTASRPAAPAPAADAAASGTARHVPQPVASPAHRVPKAAPAPVTAAKSVALSVAPNIVAPPAPPSAKPAAGPSSAAPLTDLEDRSWQLMDTVLQALREQTEELVRGTLEEFREQVEVVVRDAESRLKQRAEESYLDVEASVHTLRVDMADQLTHRTEDVVRSAETALHARVEEMFSVMLAAQNKRRPSPSEK